MKQSKYPPAKLRYGESLVAIEDFNFYKDDADAGNPYNTTVVARKGLPFPVSENELRELHNNQTERDI